MKLNYWMTETVSDTRQWEKGAGPDVVEPNSGGGETWELVGPASVCTYRDSDGDDMIRYVWTWREVPS